MSHTNDYRPGACPLDPGPVETRQPWMVIADLKKENAELNERLERERMCHAGCGVIALSNTRESLDAQLTTIHPDYMSASMRDAIACVEREISRREERDDARAERARLQRWKEEMMTVDKWWDRIDAAVRKRTDITVGTSVADAALRLIEERDELKEFIHCLP